ncbi:hypothetical protein [Eggerthella sinensis]|nr:hypothetical protein [Eggerthella sinensis]
MVGAGGLLATGPAGALLALAASGLAVALVRNSHRAPRVSQVRGRAA